MEKELTLKNITRHYECAVESTRNKLRDYYEAARQALLTHPENMEEALKNYEDSLDRWQHFDKGIAKGKQENIERLTDGYNTFDAMVRGLQFYIGHEISVVGSDIRFPAFARLTFIIQALATKYKFHSGMFSFDSSFTTHQAYTDKAGYEFHIGYDPEDSSKILISFGLDELLDNRYRDYELY